MSIADAYVDLHVDGDAFGAEVKRTVKRTNVDNESGDLGDRIGTRIGSRMLASWQKVFKGSGGALGDLFGDMGDIVGKIPTKIALIGSAVVAVIPLITSALSAAAGAATALVGALAQAGAAAIPVAALFGALIQGAIVGKMAFANFGKAVGGDKDALKALAPSARAAAVAAQGLTKQWQGVTKAVQSKVFEGMAGPIKNIGSTLLPVMKKGLGDTGGQVNLLLKDIAKFATSKTFVAQFGAILKGNTAIFGTLRKAAVPLLAGLTTLFRGIQPAAGGLAKTVVTIAQKFNGWATAVTTSGRLNNAIKTGLGIFKNLWAIVRDLGAVLVNVFGAAAGPGQGLIKTFADLAAKLRSFTSLASSKNGIAEWAQGGIDALKSVGAFISKVFGALGGGGGLGKLFDPATLTVYMDVFGQIFDAIMPIIKILKDAFQPVIIMIGKAFADLGPKIQPLFVALGPLLKGVMAVLGNIVSQAFEFIGMIAQVITPVVSFISNLIGPVIERFAPIIATIILAFTNWGGALVRLIPIVGKFAAPLVTFAGWIVGKLGPIIGFLGKIVGQVFGFIGRFIGQHVTFIGSIMSKVFNGIKTVVMGAVGFVWNLIQKYVSLWIGVFQKVGQIAGIIGRAFAALFNAAKSKAAEIYGWITKFIANFIQPFTNMVSKFLSIGKDIATGLWNGISGAASWLKDKITQWIKDTLPGPVAKLLGISSPSKVFAEMGKWVVLGLGQGVEKNLGGLSKAANKLVAKISAWKERLASLRDDSKAYAAGIVDSFKRIGDVASMSFTNDAGEAIAPTFALIKDKLTASVAQAVAFQKTMQKLQNLGLNKTALDQLYQGGPEALAQAEALAAAGKDGVSEINKLQAALEAAGKTTGASAADKFYGAGISAAEGMIKGLEKLKPAMVKVAESLGDAVAKAVKKALGIKSPSKVMEAAGINTVRGFEKGVTGKQALAADAMAGIVMPPKTTQNGGGRSYGDINVTIPVADLAELQRVEDFLAMLDSSRVRARQTNRSGQVAV